jgi:predicted AlkP superfamily phosphohydrolase/phosphomutase
LARLVESGVSGNLTTLEPQLSPILWTSIATGKMAYHRGVLSFTEVDPRSGAVVPVSAAMRRKRRRAKGLPKLGKNLSVNRV